MKKVFLTLILVGIVLASGCSSTKVGYMETMPGNQEQEYDPYIEFDLPKFF